jgi:Transposase IS66 family
MTDGYTGYQHLLDRIAGIQQCCQHVIRRARAVTKLGPGGVQNWAGDIITILGEAHRAVEDARARDSTELNPQVLDDLRERYDTAVSSGLIHNRLRDWDTGNHPGYALARWLRDYKEQVFLFTRDFTVNWTNNVSERGAKAAKRHQAVSGYWHSLPTLARWCRIRSYLDTAAAHGVTTGTPRDTRASWPRSRPCTCRSSESWSLIIRSSTPINWAGRSATRAGCQTSRRAGSSFCRSSIAIGWPPCRRGSPRQAECSRHRRPPP